MTRNAETPDTPVADGSRSAAEATPSAGVRTTQTGPVAELGLVAAGLGLVIYLIAFVADFGGSTSLVLPLLLGGGLLAGTVALPSVGTRVLAPAAVVTTTGALLLLRAVVDGGSALAVGALVLGLLEAGATVGATLMQAGVVRSRPSRNRRAPASRRSPGIPRARSSPGSSTRASPIRAPTPPLRRRRRSPATSGRASTPSARTPSTGSSTACPATRRHRRRRPPATTPPCTARRPRRSPSGPRRPIMTPRRRRGAPAP